MAWLPKASRGKHLTSFSQVKARTWLISHIISPSSVTRCGAAFVFSMVGSRCVVQDCSNCSNRAAGMALHASPTDKNTRDSWIRFVRTKRKNFHPGAKTRFVICSVHFEERCFTRAFDRSQRRQIVPGSLPTIWKTEKRTQVQESKRSQRMKEKERQKVSL